MIEVQRKQTLAEAIRELIDRVLSSVEFVADYVQLRFDGPTLTAYNPPSVRWGSDNHIWGEPGYRDALCEQIGSRIEGTTVDDERVTIAIETGATIVISLRHGGHASPEALQFFLDKSRIWVA
jgi:hypothetical protein